MIIGMITIGSNSIKLLIFKIEKNKIGLLFDKKTTIGLASYIENNILSKEGINATCEALLEYKDNLHNLNINDIHIIATASLRNIINTKEALTEIENRTNFSIDVISGEEEATLDYISASQNLNYSNGILLDIGGGSTEILTFKNNEIVNANSISIGSLKMYSKYVSDLFPSPEEEERIQNDVLDKLNRLDKLDSTKICLGVGGTIKGTYKLSLDFIGKDSDLPTLTPEKIKYIYNIYKNNKKIFLDKVLKIIPNKIHTIIPGIIILNTIVDYYKIEKIIIRSLGVSEGYLINNILNNTFVNKK